MQVFNNRTSFAADVLKSLTAAPKYLQPKYFYDNNGSRIFQDIMRMPEYYLTNCELEILESYKHDICKSFSIENGSFDLIELGAGDGLKTLVLLSYLHDQNVKFRFIPVDISPKAIHDLVKLVGKNLPAISTFAQTGDYFQIIGKLNADHNTKKILLFLGSNIGNYNDKESLDFLKQINQVMNLKDQLLIGFDLKKDPNIILKAYNDPHGFTAAFNLNLLCRINDELDADFNTENFFHEEVYDPQTGSAKSYLISEKDQQVHIVKLRQTFQFSKGEKIFMEMSQKYDLDMIEDLARKSGFGIIRNYFDQRKFFVNSLWMKS